MTALIASIETRESPFGGRPAQSVLKDFFSDKRTGIDELYDLVQGKPRVAAFLAGIAAGSPYLWELCRADPARLTHILLSNPDDALRDAMAKACQACDRAESHIDVMDALRELKQSAALTIAFADIIQFWSLQIVTKALSDVADVAISAALRWLLREAAAQGRIALARPEDPEKGSGLIVLAMGKHGAFELNYSSDVDLIVLYDPDQVRLREGVEPGAFFVRVTQGLVRLLSERTSRGYVFRLDLRLRPDPSATAVAISLPAALDYYESLGQNWERAAFIKARACAGDLEAGRRFLAHIAPFVWRKHLDYAAIADIHAMKRQINAHRGYEDVVVAGHDVKLGRGGIREIEFFVQTQQLIAGGRNPLLRSSNTLDALSALAEAGWIESQAHNELTEAYQFLRTVEHRLQMIADEQTHRVPSDNKILKSFSHFSGFSSVGAFSQALLQRLKTVQHHYACLFESSPELSSKAGSLVFTGKTDDPETLGTLQRMGFSSPAAAAEMIRGWHFGRYAATRSARAREDLTELTPVLLEAFVREGRPDAALIAFDRMLAGMPSGFQLFTILRNNVAILKVLTRVLSRAPRLADIVALHPHTLDGLLDPAISSKIDVRLKLKAALALAHGYEDALDRVRIFAREQTFILGVQALSGDLSLLQLGEHYAALADAIIEALLELASEQITLQHGRPNGARVAVLAMGKLGGREMTASSDLDLIVLYDHDSDAAETSGSRPVSPTTWFGRLTQRLIAALAAPTAQGVVFPVDMRLRPSGHKGPVALHKSAFQTYHFTEAWTWEHMALTRARIITNDADFADEVAQLLTTIMTLPRDPAKVWHDVKEMRDLLEIEKPSHGIWDIKLEKGGLVDIEFIVQGLQLIHARDKPSIIISNSGAALDRLLAATYLSAGHHLSLKEAWIAFSETAQLLKLCLTEASNPKEASFEFQTMLAQAIGSQNIEEAELTLQNHQRRVRSIFLQLTSQNVSRT